MSPEKEVLRATAARLILGQLILTHISNAAGGKNHGPTLILVRHYWDRSR